MTEIKQSSGGQGGHSPLVPLCCVRHGRYSDLNIWSVLPDEWNDNDPNVILALASSSELPSTLRHRGHEFVIRGLADYFGIKPPSGAQMTQAKTRARAFVKAIYAELNAPDPDIVKSIPYRFWTAKYAPTDNVRDILLGCLQTSVTERQKLLRSLGATATPVTVMESGMFAARQTKGDWNTHRDWIEFMLKYLQTSGPISNLLSWMDQELYPGKSKTFNQVQVWLQMARVCLLLQDPQPVFAVMALAFVHFALGWQDNVQWPDGGPGGSKGGAAPQLDPLVHIKLWWEDESMFAHLKSWHQTMVASTSSSSLVQLPVVQNLDALWQRLCDGDVQGTVWTAKELHSVRTDILFTAFEDLAQRFQSQKAHDDSKIVVEMQNAWRKLRQTLKRFYDRRVPPVYYWITHCAEATLQGEYAHAASLLMDKIWYPICLGTVAGQNPVWGHAIVWGQGAHSLERALTSLNQGDQGAVPPWNPHVTALPWNPTEHQGAAPPWTPAELDKVNGLTQRALRAWINEEEVKDIHALHAVYSGAKGEANGEAKTHPGIPPSFLSQDQLLALTLFDVPSDNGKPGSDSKRSKSGKDAKEPDTDIEMLPLPEVSPNIVKAIRETTLYQLMFELLGTQWFTTEVELDLMMARALAPEGLTQQWCRGQIENTEIMNILLEQPTPRGHGQDMLVLGRQMSLAKLTAPSVSASVDMVAVAMDVLSKNTHNECPTWSQYTKLLTSKAGDSKQGTVPLAGGSKGGAAPLAVFGAMLAITLAREWNTRFEDWWQTQVEERKQLIKRILESARAEYRVRLDPLFLLKAFTYGPATLQNPTVVSIPASIVTSRPDRVSVFAQRGLYVLATVLLGSDGDPSHASHASSVTHWLPRIWKRLIVRQIGTTIDYRQTLRQAFLYTDYAISSEHPAGGQGRRSPLAAVAVLVRDGNLYVANVGSCTATLYQSRGLPLTLTHTHRSDRRPEYSRLLLSKAIQSPHSLTVSRALGVDPLLRAAGVIAEPSIVRWKLGPADKTLVLSETGVGAGAGVSQAAQVPLMIIDLQSG